MIAGQVKFSLIAANNTGWIEFNAAAPESELFAGAWQVNGCVGAEEGGLRFKTHGVDGNDIAYGALLFDDAKWKSHIAVGDKLIDEVVFFLYLINNGNNLINGRVAA